MADRHETAGLNSLQFQDNTTRKEYSWYDRPHEELVADIREAASQARAGWEKEHEKGQPFDPAVWAGERLTQTALRATGNAHKYRLDLSLAWDAISQPHILSPEYRQAVSHVLLSGTAQRRSNLVTLDPIGAKLIDAMAEGIGIPHSRGQATVDLLPTEQQKKLFRTLHTTIAREAGI